MLTLLKKILAIGLATVTIMANTVNTYATTSIPRMGGVITDIYDAKVIAEMLGRPGAALPKGSKGIAFEVLFKDKLNLYHLFDKDFHAALNPNPIDELADILVYDSKGNVVTTYQCKAAASPSGINQLIDQLKIGKYNNTNLVATSENAQLIKDAAQNAELDVNVIDSKISSKTAERIANKALTKKISVSTALRNALKVGALSGGLEGIYAAYDAYTKGMTFDEAVSHVSVKAIEGFTAGTVSGYIVEFVSTGLASTTIPTAAVAVIPVVIGTVTFFLITNLTENALDLDTVEKKAAAFINTARTWLANGAGTCAKTIKEMAQNMKDSINDKIDHFNFLLSEEDDSPCPCGHNHFIPGYSDYVCRSL